MKQAQLFQPAKTRGGAVHLKIAVHDKTNRVAAEIILRDVARYGGNEAGLVRWARTIVERAR